MHSMDRCQTTPHHVIFTYSKGAFNESLIFVIIQTLYLHFHCESLNEPLHLKCCSYLHEQIDLSHTHIRAILVG